MTKPKPKNKRDKKIPTLKKSVLKGVLEFAPFLPVPTMPAEPYLTRVSTFRVAYYEWLTKLQALST